MVPYGRRVHPDPATGEKRMIDLNVTVEEALASQPGLASLLVRHHMICVGCDIARFHTLREAALMYHLDPEQLLNEVRQVERERQVSNSVTPPPPTVAE
jgi:hybrid cluster-associated redox disulfide protein